MAVKLAFNKVEQFADGTGVPYSGAKLFTYVGGSTNTKQTTYTESTGTTPNTNPIVLDSSGRLPQPVWLTAGVSYKFVLAPSTDTDPPVSPIWTLDRITGINDTTSTVDQWQTGPAPTFVSATSFTLVGDQTSTFHLGRRLKTTNSGGTIYSTISISAFAAVTTITVVNDSGVLDSGLSAVSYGLLSNTNNSVPSLRAKGDLLTQSAAGTLARMAVGTDGQALVANSNATNGMNWASPALRSYLAGCGLSTAGSSATMSIAAGVAVDSTNVSAMVVAAMSKTTSAWTVGTGNGGKMSAAALAAGWYHWYAIQRVDTGLVETGFDVSATAPTMPTSYTLFRRIGSAKSDGTNWLLFVQDGDYFRWSASVLDVADTNPGTSSVTKTLASVPTGINVQAYFNFTASVTTGATATRIYFRDLAAADEAPSGTAAPLAASRNTAASDTGDYGTQLIRTNTSAQIAYRLDVSDGATVVKVAILGWYDRRGRDA